VKKVILLLILVGLLSIVGFRLYEELWTASAQPPGPGGPGGGRATMLVDTAEAAPRLFTSRLEILGELRPQASVDVMSRVSGRLRELLVEGGDGVRSGQLLAVVDDEDLRQQIQRAEAAVLVARAGVNRERATLQNLSIQADRYRELHEEALVSTQDLQDVESRMLAAQAQLELAEAMVQQAEASLRELKVQQEQTLIYSPLDGFVGTRHLDPGALVNSSVPIVSVLDVSRLKTIIPVTEVALSKVRVGLSAQVVVEAYPGETQRGVITRISPFLNPETRTADVEIEIPNAAGRLKPGMFARVAVDADLPRSVLAVPRAALLTRGDQMGVYLLSEDLVTQYRRVSIGRVEEGFVEIVEGLQEGARVVTSGAQQLNEGDRVRIG
jgi:membrane fusion protein, multidrug efflux system